MCRRNPDICWAELPVNPPRSPVVRDVDSGLPSVDTQWTRAVAARRRWRDDSIRGGAR